MSVTFGGYVEPIRQHFLQPLMSFLALRLGTYSLSRLIFPSRRVPRRISFDSLMRNQRSTPKLQMGKRWRVSLADLSCERFISVIPPAQRFEFCEASASQWNPAHMSPWLELQGGGKVL